MNARPMLRCTRTRKLLGMYAALRNNPRYELVIVDADTMEVIEEADKSKWDELCAKPLVKAARRKKKAMRKTASPTDDDDLTAGLD